MRAKLSRSVSANEMREMRRLGMTNKQIADSLEISPTTVYRYIGKRSQDIEWTSLQKQPTIDYTAAQVAKREPEEDTKEEVKADTKAEAKEEAKIEEEGSKVLELVREVKIIDLRGALCTYHVDQRTGDVELGSDREESIVYGMVSGDMLTRFIEELSEIRTMLGRAEK